MNTTFVPYEHNFCPIWTQLLSHMNTTFVPYEHNFCPIWTQLLSHMNTTFVPYEHNFCPIWTQLSRFAWKRSVHTLYEIYVPCSGKFYLVNWMVAGHFAETHFAERHFTERTLCRKDFRRTDTLTNGLFAEKTFCRKDILPIIVKFSESFRQSVFRQNVGYQTGYHFSIWTEQNYLPWRNVFSLAEVISVHMNRFLNIDWLACFLGISVGRDARIHEAERIMLIIILELQHGKDRPWKP